MRLKPVTYQYRKEISPNDIIKIDLIAQDVEIIIPEVVLKEDADKNSSTEEIVRLKSN